jgi:SAM-dependent methyltransferase
MLDCPPSTWVCRFALLIPAGGAVLDVASGSGRHARWLAGCGYRVEAVDRDAQALTALADVTGVVTRVADLEDDPWPYGPACFDGVVVTNYLYRPRLERLIDAVKPGGVLIYQTFMRGNEVLGRPSNPDFLLSPGELLDCVHPRLTVVAFEQGRVDSPRPAVIQRICAVAGPTGSLPSQVPLVATGSTAS